MERYNNGLCRDAGLGRFRRGEQRDDRDWLNTVRAVPGGSRLRLVSRRPVGRDEGALPQSTVAIQALNWGWLLPWLTSDRRHLPICG